MKLENNKQGTESDFKGFVSIGDASKMVELERHRILEGLRKHQMVAPGAYESHEKVVWWNDIEKVIGEDEKK